MTDTSNGWPGKPGVPLNPEKDGWHWLQTPDGELVPYNWRPEGECEWGRWASEWIYDKEDDWNPKDCIYLDPCLTPDQATALQARVVKLEGLVAYLCGRNTDHIQVALAGNPIVVDALVKRAEAALEGKKDE